MQGMTLRTVYRTEDRCKFCNTPLGRPPEQICPFCGKDQGEELVDNENNEG